MEFSKYITIGKIILKPMTGNVVISEVDAFMCVVLSQAKEHTHYGELFVIFKNIKFFIPRKETTFE